MVCANCSAMKKIVPRDSHAANMTLRPKKLVYSLVAIIALAVLLYSVDFIAIHAGNS